jgi:serine/threonine-protein kinase
LTKTGVSLGTPLYMSPEQVRGQSAIDARTDVYSLGVIAYQMVTGALPYEGNNYADLVLKIVTGGAVSPRQIDPQLPVAFDTIIMRAMAVSADARHPNAAALAADLQKLKTRGAAIEARVSKADEPIASTPFASSSLTSYAPPARRGPLLLAVGLLCAVVAVLGALLWRSLGTTAPALDGAEPQRSAAGAGLPDVPVPKPAPAPEGRAETARPVPESAPARARPPSAAMPPPGPASAPAHEPERPQPGASASVSATQRTPRAAPADERGTGVAPVKAQKNSDEKPPPVPAAPQAPKHKRFPSEIIDPFDDHH